MTHYEMAEKLSEKMGVSLEQATAALEACEWEMLDAALMLEKEKGEARQEAYSTEAEPPKDNEEKTYNRGRNVAQGLGRLVRDALNLGNRNRFEVRKGDDVVLELPVTVLVLLLIFAFWVCIPLLVIGLFANYRYTFSGAELGRDSVNHAMDKAAEAVEKVKEEVTGEK